MHIPLPYSLKPPYSLRTARVVTGIVFVCVLGGGLFGYSQLHALILAQMPTAATDTGAGPSPSGSSIATPWQIVTHTTPQTNKGTASGSAAPQPGQTGANTPSSSAPAGSASQKSAPPQTTTKSQSTTKSSSPATSQPSTSTSRTPTAPSTATPAPAPAPTPAPTPAPAQAWTPRGKTLYVDPSLAAAGRPAQIASRSNAAWYGDWTPNLQATVNSYVSAAYAQQKLAVLVTYNIPSRDCGSYSAGGASASDAYRSWIRAFAAGVGQREAIVIIEPDALAQITCLDSAGQSARYADLNYAVATFASQTKAFIYMDAGNSGWIPIADMADRLRRANIAQARGFALNVSNFKTTADNTSYGNQISAAIGGKPFVIDTSRNGRGSNGEWCNPRGRGLGVAPTTSVGGNIDAYLWIKRPGESDGTCNGGPSAGQWWAEYANELIANAQQ